MAKSKKSSKSANKKKTSSANKNNTGVSTAVKTAEKSSVLKQAEAKAEQIVNAKEKSTKLEKTGGKTAAKKPNAVAKYFRELKSELKKVVWPSKKAVVNNSGVVLAVMCLSALVVAGIDAVFAAALNALTRLAG